MFIKIELILKTNKQRNRKKTQPQQQKKTTLCCKTISLENK